MPKKSSSGTSTPPQKRGQKHRRPLSEPLTLLQSTQPSKSLHEKKHIIPLHLIAYEVEDIEKDADIEEWRAAASNTFQAITQDLRAHELDEEIYFGNDKGLEKIDESNHLKIKERSTEEKLSYLIERDAIHEASIDQLRAEVRVLRASAEGYVQIRARFIENFRKHVLNEAPINPNIIRTGNVAAHEGDAVADALLYRTERRSDQHIFRLLYGFTHDEVLKLEALSNFIAIRVINKFGTLNSNFDPIKIPPHRDLHPNITSAFNRWLAVQIDDLSKSSDDQGNPLGHAYWQFHRAVHAHSVFVPATQGER